jgi:hypothetical protein
MGILAVLTVLFSVQAARTWFGPFQVDLAVETDAETQKEVLPPLVKQRKPPKSAYDVIATRSLFSQNRTEDVTETLVGNLKGAETSRYAKKIGLFGVIINDGEKMALINKDTGRRGSDDVMWVRVGDTIERVKVAAIERDRILLLENGTHYEVLLSDQRHSNTRAKAGKDSGPTVISTEDKTDEEPVKDVKTPKVRVKPQKQDQAKD